jgi:hypothetical protein
MMKSQIFTIAASGEAVAPPEKLVLFVGTKGIFA